MSEIDSLTHVVKRLNESVDFWNGLMIWGLVLAAIAALVVVGSTRLVVIRSKQLATAQGNLFDAKDAELRTNLANTSLEAEALRRDNLVLEKDVLKLRARTEYRHLTSEQQTTVRKAMKEYEGQTFVLVVYTSESDSSALGDDIRFTLDGVGGAGWKLAGSAGVGSAAPETGVAIKVKADASEKTLAIAGKLAEALRAQGLFAPPVTKLAKDPGTPFNMVVGSPGEAPIVIMIGRRP